MNRLPQFCPRCGEPLGLQPHDGRERPICSACGHIVYLNPAPSVAAVLFKEGRVLLVRRCIDPGYGLWSLPGGFMEMGETPEQAVIREVAEETGLVCRPTRLLDARAVIGGFYGDIVVLGYAADPLEGTLVPGGDADDVGFFEMSALPSIAFQIHRHFLSGFLNDIHSAAGGATSEG